MQLIYCNQCGSEFTRAPQWIQVHRHKHSFCSRTCYYRWSAEHRERRIKRRCLVCAKEFETIRGHIRGWMQGCFCSTECFGTWASQNRIGRSNPFYHKTHTLGTKAKIGKNSIDRQAHLALQKPESRAKALKSLFKKPNRKEATLAQILDAHFHGEWEYTGDGSHIIGGYCPDFSNCNGRKAVIELFGNYWHGARLDRWYGGELGRIMAYNALGFRCLIIWEHELKGEDAVVAKVKQFMKSRERSGDN